MLLLFNTKNTVERPTLGISNGNSNTRELSSSLLTYIPYESYDIENEESQMNGVETEIRSIQ